MTKEKSWPVVQAAVLWTLDTRHKERKEKQKKARSRTVELPESKILSENFRKSLYKTFFRLKKRLILQRWRSCPHATFPRIRKGVQPLLKIEKLKLSRPFRMHFRVSVGKLKALLQMPATWSRRRSSNSLISSTDGDTLPHVVFESLFFAVVFETYIICVSFLKQSLLPRDTDNEPVGPRCWWCCGRRTRHPFCAAISTSWCICSRRPSPDESTSTRKIKGSLYRTAW